MSAWLVFAGVVTLGGGTSSAEVPVASPVRDAPASLGWDWMDSWAPSHSDPAPWPRADAAATGVEDAIDAERIAIGRTMGLAASNGRGLAGRINRLSGGYVVVPVLTIRLR